MATRLRPRASEQAASTRPGGRPVPHRTLADAPSLLALTHPTRLALMEAVAAAGTLTATQGSEQVGESPAACAYHLRTLARLGFLEEAGRSRGRERPWRLTHTAISVDDSSTDPDAAAAARTLSAALTERYLDRIRRFELGRSRYPADIQAATGLLQGLVFATPAEMGRLQAEIGTLLRRYADRADPARRPPGSVPFELVAFTHVLHTSPAEEAPDAPPAPRP